MTLLESFFTSRELIIAYSVALAEFYVSDQTLPEAYWEAAEKKAMARYQLGVHIY